ncbi:unnamed protein product [Cylindrotheca closterium]|uniref:Beta-lactamase-related domain-containing protein n=1 Tax=Cylindrotheca closterium TaxID=2856 RepID=A0AAD2CK21_9STRA|nr:unnamed protein product [Cylindrotheca closterium]CAJ1945467.1 unnamed protein product [Cylindrotheca closterium]
MKLNLKVLTLLGIFSSILLGVSTAQQDDALDVAMKAALKSNNVRGASVAYYNENLSTEPILRAYGTTSAADDADYMDIDTVIMIASVSKVMTSTAIYKLAADNVIGLDDNICNSLPDYYDVTACTHPTYKTTPITWRMLMTHTSSMAKDIPTMADGGNAAYGPANAYGGSAVGNPTCPLTDVKGFYRDLMIDKDTKTSVGTYENDINWFDLGEGKIWLNDKPGTKNHYSNLAFGLASALLEHETNTSFATYCRDKIFKKLGMTSTAWHRKDLPPDAHETETVRFENNQFKDEDLFCFVDYASGGLRTNAKDFSLYLKAMLDYGVKLWSKELGEKSLECSEPGKSGSACDQGFGWELMTYDNSPDWLYESAQDFKWKHAAGHAGEEAGSQTQVVFFPEERVYALVFTNTGGNTDQAAQNIMKDLLKAAPSAITQGKALGDIYVADRHSTTKQRPAQRTKEETRPIRNKEGPPRHPRAKDELDDALEAVMEESKVRGAAVAYFNKGLSDAPLFRSYGYASAEADAPRITEDTAFMIASVSKVFTGTAILKLAAQDLIDLDDDICDALPDEYYDESACRNPKYNDTKITWRMLMTHTSSFGREIPGLENGDAPTYGPTGGWGGGAVGNPECPLTDVTGFYRDLLIDKETETSVGTDGTNLNWFDLGEGAVWEDWKPATKNEYSNLATGYAAALLEHVTGTSFDAYCKEHIFDAVGMDSTAWFSEDLPPDVLESQPISYSENTTEWEDMGQYCFIDYASGQLRTTARDMSRFLKVMIDYGDGMLPKGMVKTALECSEPGKSGRDCNQGFSWLLLDKASFAKEDDWLEPVTDLNWDHAAAHDGSELGSQTQVVFFPESNVYALVFINTDGYDDGAAQYMMQELLATAPNVMLQGREKARVHTHKEANVRTHHTGRNDGY